MDDLKQYKVGLYLRLSREDEEKTEVSESINNQKDFLTMYAFKQGWKIIDTYIDDGYSGTNFNRPSFLRMVEDIKKGVINLVVTKDLSRLGRNYSQIGYYVDEFFPLYNIRYIAVNDNIDTFQNDNEMVLFLQDS